MSRREEYEQKTEAILTPIVESRGFELVDVEYVKEAGTWYLRIYIDKETGVSIDDCEAVSRPLSDALDEADPIEGSYTLEVSSAGADRVLKKPEHFAQFQGAEVEVRLYRSKDGVLRSVGCNLYKQLGIGSEESDVKTPTAVYLKN